MLSSLILCNNNEPFFDWIMMCDKSGFDMTTGNDQFSGWTKKKLQSTSQTCQNLHQKKVMVTLCWSAAGLIHYSFLNLGEAIVSEKYAQQASEMH